MPAGETFSLARRRPLYSTSSKKSLAGRSAERMRGRRAGGDVAERFDLAGVVTEFAEARAEVVFELGGVGFQKQRQTFEVDAELIAQYVRRIGQHQAGFGGRHG